MTDELILSFKNTHQVIMGERALLEAGIQTKVMPVPPQVTTGCGLCLRVKPESLTEARKALAAACVEPLSVRVLNALDYAFSSALGISPGDVVAIVGCGGKTSLMEMLCNEHRARPVLMSTTTRIYEPSPGAYDWVLDGEPKDGITLACAGQEAETRKLIGLEPEAFSELSRQFYLCVAECDGSRQRPLKGWADHEPVVPYATTITVGVASLGAIGRLADEDNVHRLPIFCAQAGAVAGEPLSMEHIVRMVSSPGGMFERALGRRALFINQVESEEDEARAQAFVRALPGEFRATLSAVAIGSLHKRACRRMEDMG